MLSFQKVVKISTEFMVLHTGIGFVVRRVVDNAEEVDAHRDLEGLKSAAQLLFLRSLTEYVE